MFYFNSNFSHYIFLMLSSLSSSLKSIFFALSFCPRSVDCKDVSVANWTLPPLTFRLLINHILLLFCFHIKSFSNDLRSFFLLLFSQLLYGFFFTNYFTSSQIICSSRYISARNFCTEAFLTHSIKIRRSLLPASAYKQRRNMLALEFPGEKHVFLVFLGTFEKTASDYVVHRPLVRILSAFKLLAFLRDLAPTVLSSNDVCVVGDITIHNLVKVYLPTLPFNLTPIEKLNELNLLIGGKKPVLERLTTPAARRYKHDLQRLFAHYILWEAQDFNLKTNVVNSKHHGKQGYKKHLFLRQYIPKLSVIPTCSSSSLIFTNARILSVVIPLVTNKQFLLDFRSLWLKLSSNSTAVNNTPSIAPKKKSPILCSYISHLLVLPLSHRGDFFVILLAKTLSDSLKSLIENDWRGFGVRIVSRKQLLKFLKNQYSLLRTSACVGSIAIDTISDCVLSDGGSLLDTKQKLVEINKVFTGEKKFPLTLLTVFGARKHKHELQRVFATFILSEISKRNPSFLCQYFPRNKRVVFSNLLDNKNLFYVAVPLLKNKEFIQEHDSFWTELDKKFSNHPSLQWYE